ncbi:hypothetical protein [Alkalicoccus chagannorensis]|uniref:hypothetical protein n=1 Tax=Alkalicoccus chagannorensis TaxID=427072 RepID=UPI0012EB6D36|nr:hypothetical protein [Alkalicoccus chagannorensis]
MDGIQQGLTLLLLIAVAAIFFSAVRLFIFTFLSGFYRRVYQCLKRIRLSNQK